jgi:hypothetical protein
LTVDEKFSWKAHARYLILPTILVSIYGVATFLTPGIEFKTWLFNKQAFPNSPHVHFLNIMYPLLNYYVEFQVIFYVVRNSILLRRYGDRAEQFYSDINDGKYNNANILNYMIVINAVITIIFTIFMDGIYFPDYLCDLCLFNRVYGIQAKGN